MSSRSYNEYQDSGTEWLGRVPSNWLLRRLGYFFKERREKVSDKDFPALSVTKNGIVPQLETAAKTDDGDNRKCVMAGDFVINSRSDRKGSSGIAEQNGSVSLINIVLTPLPEIQPRFAHYLLRSTAFQEEFYRFGRGIVADLWSTNYSDMKAITLAVPSPVEQTAIAAFLDRETAKIDALVDEQKRLIELLKEKRQAVISHAVTKGLNPDVPMKDSGIEWLGKVPEHWEIAPLKRHWCVTDCKHLTAEFVDDGVPLASIRECQSKFVDLSNAKQTTIEFYNELVGGGRKPKAGDLVFTRNATVGAVAQVTDRHPEFAMGQDVCLLRKLSEGHSTDFLQFALGSAALSQQLDLAMIGSTFKRVNVEEIRNLMIAFAPRDEQVAIVELLEKQTKLIDELVEQAQNAVILLQERRAALISAAVTGKIDVRGLIDIEVAA